MVVQTQIVILNNIDVKVESIITSLDPEWRFRIHIWIWTSGNVKKRVVLAVSVVSMYT